MANIGELTVKLKGDSSGLNKTLSDSESRLKNVGGRMRGIGKGMSAAITAPLMGIGIGSIMVGANFQKSMNRVKALTQSTGGEFDKLTKTARELGRGTAFSASQAADGMGFLAMAGFKSSEIMTAMPGVLQLASAAQMDLAEAADITSNILSGFGMDAKDLNRVNNILTQTFISSNVSLSQLGEAMKYVAPIAKGAGLSIEETAAAIGLLGKQGIQGSMAGTTLRQGIAQLVKPSMEAMVTMRKLGFSAFTTDRKMKSLTEIIRDLKDAGASTTDILTIFGSRAGTGFQALIDLKDDEFADFVKSLEEVGDVAQHVSDTQLKGLSGSVTELKSAMEDAMIEMSLHFLPGMEKATDRLTKMVLLFGQASPTTQLFALAIGGILAALAPLLIIISLMLPALKTGAALWVINAAAYGIATLATSALMIATSALAVAMAPITLIILGIAAAIIAAIIVWKNWDRIVALFKETWEAIGPVFDSVSTTVEGLFNSKWGWILPGGSFINALLDLKNNWDETWSEIWAGANTAWGWIKTVFFDSFGWLLPDGQLHKALIDAKADWSEAWEGVKSTFSTLGNDISGLWTEHFGWLREGGALNDALDWLKKTWKKVWGNLSTGLVDDANAIIRTINRLIEAISGFEIGWGAQKLFGKTIVPAFSFTTPQLPKIPELAMGGIVKRPTLAMIGERGPEAVVPLGSGIGTTINVNIMGPTYGFDDFERRVNQAVRDGVRRGGFSGVLKTA